VRGVTGAAAYLPRFTDGRLRVAAPDEDAFTLLATALERLVDRARPDPRTQGVRIVGPEAARDAPMLSAVVGSPVELPSPPPRSLREALDQAARADGPEWIVVVETGEETPSGDHRLPPGAGAAALRVDQSAKALPLATLGARLDAASADEHPLPALFKLARDGGAPLPWAGDWNDDPAKGSPAPFSRPRLLAPPLTVSEGAIVPGPREEEGRSSRWRFVAERCGACEATTFPARGRCRSCGRSDSLGPEALALDGGRVVAATWIGPGGQPTEFDSVVEAIGSYGVVLVELESGVRATLAVADATSEEMRVGARVDTRLRRLYPMEGRWRYGRKAVPASRGPPAAAGDLGAPPP
jgi:uncharacterized OB-fold protein